MPAPRYVQWLPMLRANRTARRSVSGVRRDTDLDRAGMDLDLQFLDGLARATVKLIGEAPVKPDLESPAARDPDERRPLGLAQRDTSQRPRPLSRVPGGDHTEFQQSVVGLRSVERLDSAEDLAHVSRQDACDSALEKGLPVYLDDRFRAACCEVPGPGVHVGGAADAVLHPPIGLLDHAGVEPCA